MWVGGNAWHQPAVTSLETGARLLSCRVQYQQRLQAGQSGSIDVDVMCVALPLGAYVGQVERATRSLPALIEPHRHALSTMT